MRSNVTRSHHSRLPALDDSTLGSLNVSNSNSSIQTLLGLSARPKVKADVYGETEERKRLGWWRRVGGSGRSGEEGQERCEEGGVLRIEEGRKENER